MVLVKLVGPGVTICAQEVGDVTVGVPSFQVERRLLWDHVCCSPDISNLEEGRAVDVARGINQFDPLPLLAFIRTQPEESLEEIAELRQDALLRFAVTAIR